MICVFCAKIDVFSLTQPILYGALNTLRTRLNFVPGIIGLLVLCTFSLHAEDFQVTGASLFGGANFLIRTNGTKLTYESTLDDSKRRLSITIKNAKLRTERREFNSLTGPIESAFLQTNASNVVVILSLREASGYTAVLLPYSRSISVDVFRWSTLSSSEDKYRSGLIALQTNAVSVAKDLLMSAAEAKHPDATAFAGFLSAREGNFGEAKDYFLKALERKSTLADVFGGLAQVSREEKNEIKAREYENQFISKMGRPPYFDEERLKILKVAPPVSEPSSLAVIEEQSKFNKADSVAAAPQKSSDGNAELPIKELRVMQGNTAETSKSGSDSTSAATASARNSNPLAWLSNGLAGIGIALILIGLFFIRGYLRWKKSQLQRVGEQMKQRQAASTAKIFQQTMAVSEQHAANVYKRAGSLLDRSDEELEQVEPLKTKPVRNVTTKVAEKPADDLFDFDESFYASRPKSAKRSAELISDENIEPFGATSPIYNTPGEAQLSSESPAELRLNTPPPGSPLLEVDEESLENLAKQLGIDPSLLASVRKKGSSTLKS